MTQKYSSGVGSVFAGQLSGYWDYKYLHYRTLNLRSDQVRSLLEIPVAQIDF